jgi:hypothetical protein
LSSRPCLPLCRRRCKWQGPFAPRTLLRFIASTDPSATLSSSADFPGSPVIRPTLLRRFLAGTRRVSPILTSVGSAVVGWPRAAAPANVNTSKSASLRPLDVRMVPPIRMQHQCKTADVFFPSRALPANPLPGIFSPPAHSNFFRNLTDASSAAGSSRRHDLAYHPVECRC